MDRYQYLLLEFSNYDAPVRYLIVAGLWLLITVLAYQGLVKPERVELQKIHYEKQQLVQRFQQDKIQVASLQNLRKTTDTLSQQVTQYEQALMPVKHFPQALERFSTIVSSAGLKLNRLNPQAFIRSEGLLYFPVEITLQGNFLQFFTFWQYLYDQPQLLAIDTVTLSALGMGADLIIEMTLRIYGCDREILDPDRIDE